MLQFVKCRQKKCQTKTLNTKNKKLIVTLQSRIASNNDEMQKKIDEMDKIDNTRLSGENTAEDKVAVKTGRKSIATSIKKDVKKTKASGDAYTSGTGTDDHGKSYYKAMNNIGKMREEVVDEAMGYTTQKERAKQALAAYYAKKRGEQ